MRHRRTELHPQQVERHSTLFQLHSQPFQLFRKLRVKSFQDERHLRLIDRNSQVRLPAERISAVHKIFPYWLPALDIYHRVQEMDFSARQEQSVLSVKFFPAARQQERSPLLNQFQFFHRAQHKIRLWNPKNLHPHYPQNLHHLRIFYHRKTHLRRNSYFHLHYFRNCLRFPTPAYHRRLI